MSVLILYWDILSGLPLLLSSKIKKKRIKKKNSNKYNEIEYIRPCINKIMILDSFIYLFYLGSNFFVYMSWIANIDKYLSYWIIS